MTSVLPWLVLAPPIGFALWFLVVLLGESRRDRIPILCYHRVLDHERARRGEVADDEIIYAVYDDELRRQMQHLRAQGHTAIDFDELVAIRSGSMPRPKRPIAITFDDGYESVHRFAAPILRECGFKATLFVALEPDEHTRRGVAGIDDFLSVAQLRELSDAGFSIQSHTLTHPILAELDDASIRHELGASRARLEAITGVPVRHFCIPRGGGSRRVERHIAAAGYTTWCGNRKGTSHGGSPLLGLPRIVVERDMDREEFARLLLPLPATLTHMLSDLKTIPTRLGGGRFARRLRERLYTRRLVPLFRMHGLRRLVLGLSAVYVAFALFVVWSFYAR